MIPLVCLRPPDTNKPIPAGQKVFRCEISRKLCGSQATKKAASGRGIYF
jgi:hypothetical protein